MSDPSLLECRKCPRLVNFREKIAREKRKQYQDWTYWGKPVPGYGDLQGTWMIVGLAPAAHGGNRTGRVFTGDQSAAFLFRHLYAVGLASRPTSLERNDGLVLKGGYLTAVLKCVPPGDRPYKEELRQCRPYFQTELNSMPNLKLILALGRIAFDGVLDHFREDTGIRKQDFPFRHGARYILPTEKILMASYHPSPRNVHTGRLSPEAFLQVLNHCKEVLCD